MTSWTFTAIGTITSERRHRYDVPRQGTLDDEHSSQLVLNSGSNFEQALDDLQGIERIWLVYVFHLNEGWKPRVNVPRHRKDKVGVFATRAPYRPNPIGLSCVRLLKIEGLTLWISECDLLDGTPVLDIKPYLPYADSFPDAVTGWIPRSEDLFSVQYGVRAEAQMNFLREHGVDLHPFVKTQLEAAPRDGDRKRIRPIEGAANEYQLAYRTWRLRFSVDDADRIVHIHEVYSGYSQAELHASPDTYEDKDLHLHFIKIMSSLWPDR
ncbi:MAG: tRNA (N6-threonylcarbamoyladenosine(37)-N6)-methyltransferase TrmO [Bacteroidota bacterium]